jgi:hypothetical protein
MGIGSSPAGLGLSGADPVIPGSDPRKTIVAAMRYEGLTKDWELDANENFAAVTPNEQAIVLAIAVKQGELRSSPTTGNTLHEILYLGSPNLGTDITNRVLSANPIARLIAAGSVSIDRIDYQVSTNPGAGRLKVAVYFRDLDVDPNKLNPVIWST